MEEVKTMIHDQDLPMHLFAEATKKKYMYKTDCPIVHLGSIPLKIRSL